MNWHNDMSCKPSNHMLFGMFGKRKGFVALFLSNNLLHVLHSKDIKNLSYFRINVESGRFLGSL